MSYVLLSFCHTLTLSYFYCFARLYHFDKGNSFDSKKLQCFRRLGCQSCFYAFFTKTGLENYLFSASGFFFLNSRVASGLLLHRHFRFEFHQHFRFEFEQKQGEISFLLPFVTISSETNRHRRPGPLLDPRLPPKNFSTSFPQLPLARRRRRRHRRHSPDDNFNNLFLR